MRAWTIVAALCLPMLAMAKRPEVGAAAPMISLPATTNGSTNAGNGSTISLEQFKGKRTVVLAFFPKAFTGG
jgi:peroxiredoxin